MYVVWSGLAMLCFYHLEQLLTPFEYRKWFWWRRDETSNTNTDWKRKQTNIKYERKKNLFHVIWRRMWYTIYLNVANLILDFHRDCFDVHRWIWFHSHFFTGLFNFMGNKLNEIIYSSLSFSFRIFHFSRASSHIYCCNSIIVAGDRRRSHGQPSQAMVNGIRRH